jgi:hypothetical protein
MTVIGVAGMTKYRWFRLHSEVRADPKLRVLPHDERWVFICLLCFASEQEERGTIPPMSRFRLADEVADGNLELLDRTLGHLVDLDIVDVGEDGTVRFVNWRARQYGKAGTRGK